MNSILLLTRLQIKQTLGGISSAIEKKTHSNLSMVGTVLISAVLFAAIAWLGYMAYGVMGQAGLDKTVFDILFLACGTLTFTLSLPAILGTFFGSSDTNDLLPLPVSPFAISFSKALSSLATAYPWTLLILAGPLAGWGIASGAGLGYWVAYALSVVFAPMMPVAYAGTISIIIAKLFKRVRRKDTITTIATVLTLGISVAGFFVSNSLHLNEQTAAALSGLSDTMGGVVMAFPAYGFAVYALSHPDPLGCLLFVVLSVLAFAVFVTVARVLYLRIVTSLSSGSGQGTSYEAKDAQAQASPLKALLLTEVRKVVRNSTVVLYYVAYPLLIMPVLFAFIFTSDSMDSVVDHLADTGDVTSMAAGFGLTILMAVAALCTLSNRIAGTCVSREGSNWVHMKFIPVPMTTQVRAKVLPGFAVNAAIVLLFTAVGGYLFVARMGIDALVVAFGGVLMLGSAWLTTCVGTWSDSRNPHVDWGNDGDVNAKTLKGGGDVPRAMLVGIAYAALPLLVSPLVGLDPRVFMPVIAAVGIIAAIGLGHVLLAATARNIEAL